MKLQLLHPVVLFQGMSGEEMSSCLAAMKAQEKTYTKGSLILHAGDHTDRMGLVLSGSVTIENNDVWGNCTILSHVKAGEFFAETYALLPGEVMLVDVRANEDCCILFLDFSCIFGDPMPASWKEKLTRNMLRISAHKNLALTGRSFHTAPKSARGRILAYLNTVSLQKHSAEFDIPFNRQQLADYLNLERTSLSKELGKMHREGIVIFRKNHFHLLGNDPSSLNRFF